MIFSVSLPYIVLLGIENCMYTPLVQIQRDEIYERQVTFSMNKIYLHIFFFLDMAFTIYFHRQPNMWLRWNSETEVGYITSDLYKCMSV